MNRIELPDAVDRRLRLRQRLGTPLKRWTLRLKLGRWLVLPRAVINLLQLKPGDAIDIQPTPRGFEIQRVRRDPLGRARPPRQGKAQRSRS